MKQILLLAYICATGFSCFAQDKKTAPLYDIIKEISECWQDVDESNKNGIKLQAVTASFSVSKTTSVGGELKIWIFKLGRKVEKNKVSKVTLELSKGDETQRSLRAAKTNEQLTQFVNATLSDFKKMDDAKLLHDLSKRTITIEIGLTITNSGSVGGGYEIGVFSLSAEAGKGKEQGHTLTLVFSK